MTDDENTGSNLLLRKKVIYCGKCGLPPEYCEYVPDFKTQCDLWLKKHHPELRKELIAKRCEAAAEVEAKPEDIPAEPVKEVKPDNPWTTEERLMEFYKKYVPEKLETVPGLLEKYAGKEEKLFEALVKKYGPEPQDPFFSDSEDEEGGDDGGISEDEKEEEEDTHPKVRTAKIKPRTKAQVDVGSIRVVVAKEAQKKKRRVLTVVTGLETALLAVNSSLKLKDATKAFSKRFAGSSSVKDDSIILQGDHVVELAEMICDKFQIPDDCVFIDMGDGEVIPLR